MPTCQTGMDAAYARTRAVRLRERAKQGEQAVLCEVFGAGKETQGGGCMNPILFLDIDGVLNRHCRFPNGYCGIDREQVEVLNEVLYAVPSAKLVISSAWRYEILNGNMTLKGFEYLLLVHGIACRGRLAGHTAIDPCDEPNHYDAEAWRVNGLRWRAEQIREYVEIYGIERYAVVDDLDLQVPNFVRTDGAWGITDDHAERIIALLKG
jgi:hypothetical protein